MIFYTSPIACVIIALILSLHIAVALLDDGLATLLGIINVCLHIALLAVLLLTGARLGEVALLLAAGTLVAIGASAAVRAWRSRTEKKREESKDDL